MKRLLMVMTAAVTGSAFAEFIYQSTISPTAGQSVEVAFPVGVYSNAEPMKIELPSTLETSVRLYGPQTTWIVPDRGFDYPAYPFHVTVNGKDAVYLKPAATLLANAPFKFENFDFTTSYRATGKHFKNVFTGGTYNFYDPNGSVPATVPEIYFDQKNGSDLAEFVFDNATTRMGKVFLSGTTAELYRMVFNGGSHTIASDLQIGYSSAKEYEVLITNKATVAMTGGEAFRFNACKRGIVYIEDSSVSVTPTERYLGNSDFTDWTFAAKNSSIRFAGNLNLNGFSDKNGDKGVFALTNSLLTVAGAFAMNDDLGVEFVDCVVTNSSEYRVGNHANTTGDKVRIAYRGSNCRSYVAADVRFGDQAGLDAEVEFAGGYHRFACSQATWKIGEHSSSVINLKVSGGTVERRTTADAYVPFELGYTAGAQVDLELSNGGMIIASAISKKTVGTTVNFTANGGTFKAGVGGTIVSGLDSAVIGANGFTIDTNGKNVTINQSFSGSGKLILKGGGTVTFASGVTIAGGLEIQDGTAVVFNDVIAPASLKLAATASLTIPHERTVPISGDLDAAGFNIAFSDGTYTNSPDLYTIFTVGGALVGETAAKWEDAIVSGGISLDSAIELIVDTAANPKTLGFIVRDPIAVTITVGADETVVTNKEMTLFPGDSITFNIAAGGSFSSDYPIRRGVSVVKNGAGTLHFGSDGNAFSTFIFTEGVLSLDGNGSLGGANMWVNGITDTTEMILDVEGAVTNYTYWGGGHPRGAIRKRGSGEYIWSYGSDIYLGWRTNMLTTVIEEGIYGFTCTDLSKEKDALQKFTSTYSNPVIGSTNTVMKDKTAQPTFRIGHANMEIGGLPTYFPAVKKGMEGDLAAPTLEIIDSRAVLHSLAIGGAVASAEDMPAVTPTIRIRNSTLRTNYGASFYNDAGRGDYSFTHGSEFAPSSGGWQWAGEADWSFDASSFGAGDRFVDIRANHNSHLNTFVFTNGSTAYIAALESAKWSSEHIAFLGQVFDMTFDNSKLVPGTNTTEEINYESITAYLRMRGRGLILEPSAGAVWTLRQRLTGEGGFVKAGAGTVKGTGSLFAYSGATELAAGTLDLDGSTVTNMILKLKGGSLANALLVNPTFVLDVSDEWTAAVPAVIDPASVSGRVVFDLGRTAANPLPLPYQSIDIATYTGETPPDISHWSVQGTGIPDTSVILAVDTVNKKVIATAQSAFGFILLLK